VAVYDPPRSYNGDLTLSSGDLNLPIST